MRSVLLSHRHVIPKIKVFENTAKSQEAFFIQLSYNCSAFLV
jgi:hypothetical protein